MKAIQIINPGNNSSLEIQEVPTPEPNEHEILVKIEAAVISRADLHKRAGKYSPFKTNQFVRYPFLFSLGCA